MNLSYLLLPEFLYLLDEYIHCIYIMLEHGCLILIVRQGIIERNFCQVVQKLGWRYELVQKLIKRREVVLDVSSHTAALPKRTLRIPLRPSPVILL